MSSAMRRYAQIPNSMKYFIVLTNSVMPFDVSGNLFSNVKPMMSLAEFEAVLIPRIPALDISAGFLLKDLGRTVVRYNAVTNEHVGYYRQVMQVKGQQTEGIGDISNNIFYIKTWSPANTYGSVDGEVSIVARTGPGVA
jgi:hypothetical protein